VTRPAVLPVLPDVVARNLRVLFCGMAAGTRSAAVGAYYAGPGNKFWPILHKAGLTDTLLRPQQFRAVLRYRIGLTDLVKTRSGSDRAIRVEEEDRARLTALVGAYAPRVLAFVGKNAARSYLGGVAVGYGLQTWHPDGSDGAVFVLPSTSGAANGFWDEGPWFDLAAYLRDGR
jgi:TDG/mug DNA glycosylase family protein